MLIQGPAGKIRDSQSQVTILNHTLVADARIRWCLGDNQDVPSVMDAEKAAPAQLTLAKVTGSSELLLAWGNAPKFLMKNHLSYKKPMHII